MSILQPLLLRTFSLIVVFFVILFLLIITLGATGFSDRTLRSIVNEDLRGIRTGLAQTIRDPNQLESVMQERRQDLESFYDLDKAWYVRLPDSLIRVITLDLGEARNMRAFEGSKKISRIVLERLPNTMILLTTSFLITTVIGLAVGTYLSTHPGSRLDRIISYFAAISFAIPAWWLGIILILLFAIQFRIFPSGGMYSSPPPVDSLPRFFDLALHATLPVITLVLVSLGPYIYVVRTMTINIAQEDFVRTARAKGLRERRVLIAHILRVASPPIVTGLILGLTGTLGGSILIETVFDWQGMGRLYFETFAGTPDEGMIVALTFVFTLMYIVARIILEIMYVLLDPRVRY